jgi:hypothetical protein
MQWLNDIELLLTQGLNWRGDNEKVMASLFSGETIDFTTADGQPMTGKVTDEGKVVGNDG